MDQNRDDRVTSVSAAAGLVQNFFIVFSQPGSVPTADAGAGADHALEALKSALAISNERAAPPSVAPVTFTEVANEWFINNASAWRHSYALRLKNRLQRGLLDHLGRRPLASISSMELLETVRRIEARDARETARRVLRIAGAVFRYGVATGRCGRDPTVELKGALKPARAARHRASLPVRELPRFMRALSAYQGDLTRLAMELVLLTFVRTAELRFARWSEFEGLEADNPVWRVPAERMKMGRAHLVPLPPQAVRVLHAIRELQHGSHYLFPASTRTGVISENTLLFALYRMGYRRRATVHGFRSLASTVLNEAQFNRDWIEMQLAHSDSSVRGVYNAAEWMPGRRQMMEWWADYLDRHRR